MLPALKMKSIPGSFCLLSLLQRSDRPPQLPRTVSPCHSRQNKIVLSVSGEAKLTFTRNDNKSHYLQSPYFSVSWTVVETNWFSRWERESPTRWLHMKMTPVSQCQAHECSCSLLLPAAPSFYLNFGPACIYPCTNNLNSCRNGIFFFIFVNVRGKLSMVLQTCSPPEWNLEERGKKKIKNCSISAFFSFHFDLIWKLFSMSAFSVVFFMKGRFSVHFFINTVLLSYANVSSVRVSSAERWLK